MATAWKRGKCVVVVYARGTVRRRTQYIQSIYCVVWHWHSIRATVESFFGSSHRKLERSAKRERKKRKTQTTDVKQNNNSTAYSTDAYNGIRYTWMDTSIAWRPSAWFFFVFSFSYCIKQKVLVQRTNGRLCCWCWLVEFYRRFRTGQPMHCAQRAQCGCCYRVMGTWGQPSSRVRVHGGHHYTAIHHRTQQ